MYPNNYFWLFPAFPRNNKVFVAMSYDERLSSRWEEVIKPAISRVGIDKIRLEPNRVDTGKISDSNLTKILEGVSDDRLILADITSLDNIGERPIRNENVMYEIGLAHARRLPEEVLLFRSDSKDLPFDFTNLHVNHYKPDKNPIDAKNKVSEIIVESLKEIDLKRHLAVKTAAQTLDHIAWGILVDAAENGEAPSFRTQSIAESIHNNKNNEAILRLLALGALETNLGKLTPEILKQPLDLAYQQFYKYRPTKFGMAIIEYIGEKIVKSCPREVIEILEIDYQQNSQTQADRE